MGYIDEPGALRIVAIDLGGNRLIREADEEIGIAVGIEVAPRGGAGLLVVHESDVGGDVTERSVVVAIETVRLAAERDEVIEVAVANRPSLATRWPGPPVAENTSGCTRSNDGRHTPGDCATRTAISMSRARTIAPSMPCTIDQGTGNRSAASLIIPATSAGFALNDVVSLNTSSTKNTTRSVGASTVTLIGICRRWDLAGFQVLDRRQRLDGLHHSGAVHDRRGQGQRVHRQERSPFAIDHRPQAGRIVLPDFFDLDDRERAHG